MRNLSVIALSMMVVVPAVAPNSARAQDPEIGASVPAVGQEATGPATLEGQAAASSDEPARKPKRKAAPAQASTEAAEPADLRNAYIFGDYITDREMYTNTSNPVVLDDNNGIALIAQLLQQFIEPVHVARV